MQVNMKLRNILYGYMLENGKIKIQSDESDMVKKIYKSYLDGKSLLDISKILNEKQIEYMPGVIGWNKARLKRIIDNEKYTGIEPYPQIITKETFDAIQQIKASRNTQTNVDWDSEIYIIADYVRCPLCGERMKRQHDDRHKCHDSWHCVNKDCKTSVKISDKNLINNITDLINKVTLNPEIISTATKTECDYSLKVIKLNNEISRMLNASSVDKDVLKNIMFRCLSEKYKNIDMNTSMTKYLKDVFINAKPPDKFPRELLEKTAKAIVINTDTTLQLTLRNGQNIGKELFNNADNGNPNN